MEYLTLLFSQTVNVLLVVINFMTIQFTLSLLLSDSLLRKIMALISIFICYMMLLLLLHAEFLAFVLIILYVGAIAVLFLFVVMLINLTKIYSTLLTIYQKIAMLYLPCILIFLFYFLVQHKKTSMSFFINIEYITLEIFFFSYLPRVDMFHISYLFQTNSGILWDFLNITDVEHLGIFLWSWYPIFIGLAGLMLLVSIIGSIINSQGMFYLNTQKRMYLKNKS